VRHAELSELATPSVRAGDVVFVYGTLRKGQKADITRSNEVEFIEDDAVNGVMTCGMYFPTVKLVGDSFTGDKPVVVGESYAALSDTVGTNLDWYEGHPTLFLRKRVMTAKGYLAWVYEYQHSTDSLDKIPSGDWAKHMEKRP